MTQQAGTLTVTLRITPAKFGANTFVAQVKNPDGSALTGGNLSIASSMVEMDMGTQIIPLSASAPGGSYQGQGELTMAGHWRLETVIRFPQSPSQTYRTTFTVNIGY